MCISVIRDLYIALCAHHPKSDHLLSSYIWPPLPFTTLPPGFPMVTTLLLPLSMSFCLFAFLVSHLLLSVLYPTYEWSHMVLNFLSDLFCFAWYSQVPSMLSQMAVLYLFLWLSSSPSYMYHVPFIRSSIEGHFDCFHVLATMNNAAVNLGLHISLQINAFNFCGVDTQKMGCWVIWPLCS